MTNVLVEGGSGLLGSFFDQNLANELHVFIAPKIVGGAGALSAVGGKGLDQIPQVGLLQSIQMRESGGDVYIHGVIAGCS